MLELEDNVGLNPTPALPGPGSNPGTATKRYGPYQTHGGHWFWRDYNLETKTTRSVLVHRELVEQHLNRKLGQDEVIHHIDGNPSNNTIQNLEVQDRKQHSVNHAKPSELIAILCKWCGKQKEKLARQIRQSQIVKKDMGHFVTNPVLVIGVEINK